MDKDALLEKAEARSRQIDAEIQRLKAKADEAEADMKLNLERDLKEVQQQRKAFQNRISELKSSSDQALNDLQEGFERAWTALSDSVSAAAARFN